MNVIGEKDIDVERYVVSFEIDQCLDPAGQDQQEPSQCETGVKVFELDPVVSGTFEKNAYEEKMRKNLEVLMEALK